MRITTWNVNGLRAVLNRDGFTWLDVHAPDVLCLQEIKSRPEQINDDHMQIFSSYQTYWNPGQRPGYSGVLTMSLNDPLSIQIGLGSDRYDSEGRVILTEYEGFYLFNVYFPNGQRDQGRLSFKLDFYADLLALCDRMHSEGKNLIICGDFNTAHQEIDLRYPKQNQKTSGFMPEERAWIDIYLSHNLVDAYRAIYPDRVQYTWWTYRLNARARNIGWRLDYFLVSKQLMPRIKDVIIHEEIPGSDHCPVTLVVD